MNKKLLAALLPLFVVGCVTPIEKTTLQTQGISVDGASTVAFHNVQIEGETLTGSLVRIGHNPVHFGHLDYHVTDSSGKVLQSGQTDYSGAIKQRRSPNASHFRIPLQQPWQVGIHHAAIVWHNQSHQQ
ncbi:MAG: hypothetical protein RI964_3086 [Pseudomonadota bacterium]